MKKILILILAICILACLASCQLISGDHEHKLGEYRKNESQHWRNYTCGCDLDPIYENHLDNDFNGLCDGCGYQTSTGLGHVCSTDYRRDSEYHCLYSVCGCHGFPEFFEPHYSNDNDTICDACGYTMAGGEIGETILLSDHETWLKFATSDGIVEVKTTLDFGSAYGDLITIQRTTDKDSIAQMIEAYKNVELQPVPEFVDFELPAGSFEIEFTFAGGDVESVRFAGRSLYTDYNIRKSFFASNIPTLEDCPNYITSYSFATYGKDRGIVYNLDENMNLTEYCELDNIGELEFVAYDDVYVTENLPTHVIKTEFGDIFIMSHKTFYITDDSGNNVWFDLKDADFYRMFERALQTDFTVTMNDLGWLAEELQPTYKAGDTVTVKIGMATDTGYMFFVNGEQVTESGWGDGLWIFTFTMPECDVVIDFKTYDGFLPHYNYSVLIERYWLDHFNADSVWVQKYYGEFESGAIVAYMGCDCCGYDEALWTERVGEYEINYYNGHRIELLYEGEFYTLTEAYENGWLTDENIAEIAEKHNTY